MNITIKLPYHIDSYTVNTNCKAILDNLRSLYGAYCTDKTDGSINISVFESDSGFTVECKDKRYITAEPMGCIHNIIYSTKRIVPGIFAMHAGAVCLNGTVTVFAASTTTGKTTLISYLIRSGFEYVSDDCVFINMTDLSVYPFHNPLHLREGGAEILRKCGKLPEDLVCADERYVYLPQNLSPEKMVLDRIYFIERTEDVNAVLTLDRKEAFNRLMLSPITAYNITPNYIRFLGTLLPFCMEMQYSDMEYVLEQIK